MYNIRVLQKEEKDKKLLKDLRDKAVFTFFMLNALYVLVILMLQLHSEDLSVEWPLGGEVCTPYIN
jgi:chitin synthase